MPEDPGLCWRTRDGAGGPGTVPEDPGQCWRTRDCAGGPGTVPEDPGRRRPRGEDYRLRSFSDGELSDDAAQ